MTLSRQHIARTGLRLLNRVGLSGLTLRLIARELGVKAPALYWHVSSKQELLDEMATQMYEDAGDWHSDNEVLGWEELEWDEFLARNAYALRRTMLGYRDGAKVFSGTFFTGSVNPSELPLRKLIEAGLPPRQAGTALLTVYSFVIGFTIEEQAVFPVPGQRDNRYDRFLESARKNTDPEVVTALSEGLFGVNQAEDQFTDGLRTVLSGIREQLASSSCDVECRRST